MDLRSGGLLGFLESAMSLPTSLQLGLASSGRVSFFSFDCIPEHIRRRDMHSIFSFP